MIIQNIEIRRKSQNLFKLKIIHTTQYFKDLHPYLLWCQNFARPAGMHYNHCASLSVRPIHFPNISSGTRYWLIYFQLGSCTSQSFDLLQKSTLQNDCNLRLVDKMWFSKLFNTVCSWDKLWLYFLVPRFVNSNYALYIKPKIISLNIDGYRETIYRPLGYIYYP